MFGYVRPRTGELLVREYELYKAAYCGLCAEGGKDISRLTRAFLNYDFVFLCLLRMAVTGEKPEVTKKRCPYKLSKRPVLVGNKSVRYTCAAFAELTYYKRIDDISDSRGMKKLAKKLTLPVFSHMNKRASALYPELGAIIRASLSRLAKKEREGCGDIDDAADPFACLMRDVCAYGTSGAEERILSECGYHLGRYIYIIDAYEDSPEDEKERGYNVLNVYFGSAAATAEASDAVRRTLDDSMKALCRAFALSEPCGYENLICNIASAGSADAFSRIDAKLKGNDR